MKGEEFFKRVYLPICTTTFQRNACGTTLLHKAHGPSPHVCRLSAAFHLESTDDPSPQVFRLLAALQVEPTVVLRSPGVSEKLRK
jgi:hypothetical protein